MKPSFLAALWLAAGFATAALADTASVSGMVIVRKEGPKGGIPVKLLDALPKNGSELDSDTTAETGIYNLTRSDIHGNRTRLVVVCSAPQYVGDPIVVELGAASSGIRKGKATTLLVDRVDRHVKSPREAANRIAAFSNTQLVLVAAGVVEGKEADAQLHRFIAKSVEGLFATRRTPAVVADIYAAARARVDAFTRTIDVVATPEFGALRKRNFTKTALDALKRNGAEPVPEARVRDIENWLKNPAWRNPDEDVRVIQAVTWKTYEDIPLHWVERVDASKWVLEYLTKKDPRTKMTLPKIEQRMKNEPHLRAWGFYGALRDQRPLAPFARETLRRRFVEMPLPSDLIVVPGPDRSKR